MTLAVCSAEAGLPRTSPSSAACKPSRAHFALTYAPHLEGSAILCCPNLDWQQPLMRLQHQQCHGPLAWLQCLQAPPADGQLQGVVSASWRQILYSLRRGPRSSSSGVGTKWPSLHSADARWHCRHGPRRQHVPQPCRPSSAAGSLLRARLRGRLHATNDNARSRCCPASRAGAAQSRQLLQHARLPASQQGMVLRATCQDKSHCQLGAP